MFGTIPKKAQFDTDAWLSGEAYQVGTRRLPKFRSIPCLPEASRIAKTWPKQSAESGSSHVHTKLLAIVAQARYR